MDDDTRKHWEGVPDRCLDNASQSLMFDVLVEQEGEILVMPVLAADAEEAVEAGKDLYPGRRVAVVRKG